MTVYTSLRSNYLNDIEFSADLGVWKGRGAKELWQGLRGYSALVGEETPGVINAIFSLKYNGLN